MKSKVSYEEVSDFIKFCIRMGGVFDVDLDGYIVSKVSEEKFTVNINGKERNIIIFQKEIDDNDAIILNPLNESVNIESKDKVYFYKILSLGLFGKVTGLVNRIIDTRLSKDGEDIPINIAKFVSQFSDIDEKFKSEFELLIKDNLKFMNVFYRKKFKEARFRCLVFEEDERQEFKIRKKSWKTIDKIFNVLFNIPSDIEDREQYVIDTFSYKTTNITCPKLKSTLMVYNKLYFNLNKYFEIMELEDLIVDLTELSYYINNLEKYYNKVKWMVQPTSIEDEKEEVKSESEIITNQPYVSETPNGVPIVTKSAAGSFHIGGNYGLNNMASPINPIGGGMANPMGGGMINPMGGGMMNPMGGGMINPTGGMGSQQIPIVSSNIGSTPIPILKNY